LKKGEDRVNLTYKDVTAREKARTLKSVRIFNKFFSNRSSVLQKTYPAYNARLNGLRDIRAINDEDSHIEKRMRSTVIMKSLQKENHSLLGHLVRVRIVSNQPKTSSFHVRLGLSTKDCSVIHRGSDIFDSQTHAIAMADPLKEIRHCLRCHNYGYLSRFCKSAAEIYGKCAGPHATSSCKLHQKTSNAQTALKIIVQDPEFSR
jgi:hypothetical protein